MKKYLLYAFAFLLFIGWIDGCIDGCTSSKGEENSTQKELTIDDAIRNNDFKTCNELLTEYYSKNGSYRYMEEALKVLKAEGSYLIDVRDAEAEKLFLLCLNDVILKIEKYRPQEMKNSEYSGDNNTYIDSVTPYNACLIALIRESLIKDNLSFAEVIYPYVKVNLKKQTKSGGVFTEFYTYTFDCTEQQTAKKLISDYKNKNK